MNSTREQRRTFVKNAKKRWKRGDISKLEYLNIKNQISDMGKEQSIKVNQEIREQKGVKILTADDINLVDELMDDDEFTPKDL